MKSIVIIFVLSTVAFLHTYSQTNDYEARILYREAQEAYDSHDYAKTENLLIETFNKLGKTNPTIEYLHIKALYDGLQNNTWPKNTDNYNLIMGHIRQLLSMIDKNTYPQEKYDDILKIKLDVERDVHKTETEKIAAQQKAQEDATQKVEREQAEAKQKAENERISYYQPIINDLINVNSVTLGSTTVGEFLSSGGKKVNCKDCKAEKYKKDGYSYFSYDGSKISELALNLCSGPATDKMPDGWNNRGLRKNLSENEWIAALKSLNFSVSTTSSSDDGLHSVEARLSENGIRIYIIVTVYPMDSFKHKVNPDKTPAISVDEVVY